MRRFLAVAQRWEMALVALILLTLIAGSQLSPYFLNTANLLSQTRSFIVIGLLALGLTIVVILGEIDLSGESILAVCAVTLGLLYEAGFSISLASSAAILLGATLGALNGAIVGLLRLPSLVVTLASLIAYRGLAFVILERRPISSFPDAFVALGNGTIASTQIPQSLGLFFLAAVVLAFIVHNTRYGRRMYAAGNNASAAALSGVSLTRIRISSFALSGMLAGLGAVLLAARFDSVRADAAEGALLSALTAVLLGGVSIFGGSGTLGGVLLSLVLVGLMQNGMQLANIPAEVQQLVIGGLLIAAVVIPRMIENLNERDLRRQSTSDLGRAAQQS